jgi:hypothetical protein
LSRAVGIIHDLQGLRYRRRRASDRWIARISRMDGKFIQAGNGWQNSFYDTTGFTIAAEATKYAKAAIDGREIR